MVEKTAEPGSIAAADFKRISGFVSGLACPLTDFTVASLCIRQVLVMPF